MDGIEYNMHWVLILLQTTDGRIEATNDVVAYASDKRLKENVEPITDALIKIDKLSGMTYNWNQIAEKLGWIRQKPKNGWIVCSRCSGGIT